MTWLMLITGLLLLIVGAELLVRGSARLAASLGVPALVIGLTVVAFGTSAPELAVSVKSAWAGQAELAIANVVGSNIFNVLVILGLAALISPLVVSKQLIRQDVPIMILVSVVAVLMAWDGTLGRAEAVLLFAGLLGYTAFLFVQGRRQGMDMADEGVGELIRRPVPAWQNLLLVAGGLVLLVAGARWLVQSAVQITAAFGVSEAVIGLTIVAAGTSLPEVITSVIATLKGQRDIVIGNVVGSNVFNILCVLGLSGLVSSASLLAGGQLASLDMPVMLGVAVLCCAVPAAVLRGRLPHPLRRAALPRPVPGLCVVHGGADPGLRLPAPIARGHRLRPDPAGGALRGRHPGAGSVAPAAHRRRDPRAGVTALP